MQICLTNASLPFAELGSGRRVSHEDALLQVQQRRVMVLSAVPADGCVPASLRWQQLSRSGIRGACCVQHLDYLSWPVLDSKAWVVKGQLSAVSHSLGWLLRACFVSDFYPMPCSCTPRTRHKRRLSCHPPLPAGLSPSCHRPLPTGLLLT